MTHLKEMLAEWNAANQKEWEHDRTQTVGASEIFQCARKVFLTKNQVPQDEDFDGGFGALVRGNLIENEVWEPAIRHYLQHLPGVEFLHAGEGQETVFAGFLSSTSDGCIINRSNSPVELFGVILEPGQALAAECKSIDPRVTLKEPKPEHFAQVRVQIEMLREVYGYDVIGGILTYINASFIDDVTEFVIERDEAFFEKMRDRARSIMTASSLAEFKPEGKMAGGKECQYCPFQSHCADFSAGLVPQDANDDLDEQTARNLDSVLEARERAIKEIDNWKATKADAEETAKELMRQAGTRKAKTANWSLSYSSVKGRVSVDIKAAEAAGVDLSAFKKEGDPSDRLTIKSV